LLVPGVIADHPHNAVTPDDFALGTKFFNRRSHFHAVSPSPGDGNDRGRAGVGRVNQPGL